MKLYTLDRYHRAGKMAQGAKVHAETDDEAIRKARLLFDEPEYRDDVFRIVDMIELSETTKR